MTDIPNEKNQSFEEKISQLENDIKSITIQGATNVALTILEGIILVMQKGSVPQRYKPAEHFKSIALRLAYARPTEPLAQNALRFIFDKMDESNEYYLSKINQYKDQITLAKKKMASVGVGLIQNGGVYLTHCHSSTVISMFMEATREGKRFTVYATETRPKYQGRKTVAELLEAGVDDVTLIIDDVAPSLLEGRLKTINAVFIGADLLSQNGFVNKVGSLGIAYASQRCRVPLYCMSILLKYDPRPYSSMLTEQRSSQEIWDNPPKDLKFYAPAFDFVPYSTGVNIICENGIIQGKDVASHAYLLYPVLGGENG